MAKPFGIHLDISSSKLPAGGATGIGGSRVTTPLRLQNSVTHRVAGGADPGHGHLLSPLGEGPGHRFKPDSTHAKVAPPVGGNSVGRVSVMVESMRTDGRHEPRTDAQLEALLFSARPAQPIRFVQLGASDATPSTPMGFRSQLDVSDVPRDQQAAWGRWLPDPRMGYEPPSHWGQRDGASVGGQPASYRAFAATPIDTGDVAEFVQTLRRFGAPLAGGAAPAQVLEALKAGGYRTLDNGHAYVEFNHGMRGRSGASDAQLFVFGVEIKPAAMAPIREQLEAAGQ